MHEEMRNKLNEAQDCSYVAKMKNCSSVHKPFSNSSEIRSQQPQIFSMQNLLLSPELGQGLLPCKEAKEQESGMAGGL